MGQLVTDTVRKDALRQLGVELEDVFTAEQAMNEGHLGGWNVRKVPMYADVEQGVQLQVPNKYANVRDNPYELGRVDVLGVVGENHTNIQNEEHAELLNTLVDESGASFTTAGAVNGGRRVFISMKLPSHMQVGGVDRIDNYITAVNSHDGSMSFTFFVHPVRFACMNMIPFAGNVFRVRHTSGAQQGIVTKARQALDLTFGYLDEFQQQAEELINTTMTQRTFEQLIKDEFGVDDDAPEATITRAENKLDKMSELFADACTQEGIRETAWAGYNALAEWYDHYSPTRGDDRDKARATKAVFNPTFKHRALELVRNA